MKKEDKVLVLGASGLVGGAIVRKLIEKGYKNIIGTYNQRKPELDKEENVKLYNLNLLNQSQTEEFFQQHKPDYVFLAAAKVGGILANDTYKADFIYENLAIALNTINASFKTGIKKLLNLGSSCIYPKYAPQPMKEEYLLTGSLEPTNEPYAIAKISAIKLCRYFNQQYGTNYISAMPTNIYGPYDNFNLETSHVLPALIRKFHLAKLLEEGDFEGIKKDFQKYPIGFGLDDKLNLKDKQSILSVLKKVGITSNSHRSLTLWGSGEVYREFLYVDDLADACVYLMENIDAEDMRKLCPDYFVNVGTGEDLKIKDLATMIKDIVGFKGDSLHDLSKPDGTPRKLLDVSKIKQLGWKPKVSLEEGIRRTYEWYLGK
ncbi:GDP-L-fucose synthase family protein [Calditerrivibrio nitroreducens]|uniref:GDP-L-fucose synthase n=1 Tax=Calditerrivibrio nitroreducens (strain DSM 19672 / NBRC 101217 / Yu37-1) TaxID=768670 RepID=E4THC3_CALNY|nr:GDP-L-fucose synthase [Calditerrivibrio nitroreducens]ADR19858.1 NAD-dependent epimerase/dehydratase [Calditerrivibrio nitroreducens DSM 19672]